MKYIAWLGIWLYKHFTETPGLNEFTGWLWHTKASKHVQWMMLVLGVSREPRKCPEVWLTVPRLPPPPSLWEGCPGERILVIGEQRHSTSWKMISQFPVAAVTDNHQFSGSKQCKSIILQFCHSEAWNGSHWAGIKMLAGYILFWRLSGESVFFPAL